MNAQQMLRDKQTQIKDIVNLNISAAKVFENYGIDFCCGGNRSLTSVLENLKSDKTKLIKELEEVLENTPEPDKDFQNWDMHRLSSYIVTTHHDYIRNSSPSIQAHLEKIVFKHGKKHNFLAKIQRLFSDLTAELNSHMMKEEKILFPLVKYIEDCKKFNEKPRSSGYGTVKNPIHQMVAEHDSAGDHLEEIRKLTGNYTLPEDACATFRLTYHELQKFENDLHQHIHLENNILFPKAVVLEEELLHLDKKHENIFKNDL